MLKCSASRLQRGGAPMQVSTETECIGEQAKQIDLTIESTAVVCLRIALSATVMSARESMRKRCWQKVERREMSALVRIGLLVRRSAVRLRTGANKRLLDFALPARLLASGPIRAVSESQSAAEGADVHWFVCLQWLLAFVAWFRLRRYSLSQTNQSEAPLRRR